jgi:hypothetical protein
MAATILSIAAKPAVAPKILIVTLTGPDTGPSMIYQIPGIADTASRQANPAIRFPHSTWIN